jgi:hypothetical protein
MVPSQPEAAIGMTPLTLRSDGTSFAAGVQVAACTPSLGKFFIGLLGARLGTACGPRPSQACGCWLPFTGIEYYRY